MLWKKMVFYRTFLWVLPSGKIQNPRNGSAREWFCRKLTESFIILYQKKVLPEKGSAEIRQNRL